jgi:hypothetical protein
MKEETFVTRVHDFTINLQDMKDWLEHYDAQGSGDTPEAVAVFHIMFLNYPGVQKQ